MNPYLKAIAIAACLQACRAGAIAQVAPDDVSAEQILSKASADQKYTFLVFHRDNGPATQAMLQTVRRGVESRADQATLAIVDVKTPANKTLVDRYDVGRAPMPLTLALAPNGAMTTVAPKKISTEQIEKAFVTPAAAFCMKSMQDGKFVFVCVQSAAKPVVPPGVKVFNDDAEFKGRAVVALIKSGDSAEAEFLEQLEIEPNSQSSTTVFLAPPGVLVGKFAAGATKDQFAAALHKAGKCCEDENCKHNKGAQPTGQRASGSRKATQNTGTRRN